MGSEDASAIPFGELATFVVEVFGGGDVMDEVPFLLGGDEAGGEYDGMERYIIFTHELIKLDIIVLIKPPSFVVLLEQVGSNRNIADRSIEPNVENLILEFFNRHAHTPLQVTSDAFGLQPF